MDGRALATTRARGIKRMEQQVSTSYSVRPRKDAKRQFGNGKVQAHSGPPSGGSIPEQKAVSWRMEEFRKRIDQVLTKPFSISDLKVNGKDVMDVLNIPPSRKVGEILDQLFQEVLEDSSKNNRDYLLEKLKQSVS